uniref:Tf2-1-like SH3-like domain-containing protein n=1 Tax=Triticum urartu TaxID=4572 RepID=A0A8R7RCG1_TRIUA
MEMYLRCVVHEAPRQWCRWLPIGEFWYNSLFHSSIKCTPFKALYGVEPNLGAMTLWDDKTVPMIDGDPWDWGLHTAHPHEQILRAQHRFKKQADQHRSKRSFVVGDAVLLKLQPYAQSSVANRPCAKLAYKYFGSFSVIDKIGKLAYKLELPADNKIHPVFHVSQLKPFTPNYTPVFFELPRPPDLAGHDDEPVEIVERRMVKHGTSALLQVKVRWRNDETATTWEDYDTLRRRFPQA